MGGGFPKERSRRVLDPQTQHTSPGPSQCSMAKGLGEGLGDGLTHPRSRSWGTGVPRPLAEAGLSVSSDRLACPRQGVISRGYSYTLQRNNGESWDLTDSAGNKLTAPAVCFMIPPTDPEALALANRYRGKGGSQPGLTAPSSGPSGPIHSPGHPDSASGGH